MSNPHRGPRSIWVYHKDEKARELYDKGKDSERVAYALGLTGAEVRKYLGKRIDKEREEKALTRISKSAWKRIVENEEGFYSVRDVLKVNTHFLLRVLRAEFEKRGLEDRSYDLCYEDEVPYAVMVYKESNKDLYVVKQALEVSSQKAKSLLDDEYDPYAYWSPTVTEEIEQKVRDLYAKGKSFAQIDWMLRNDYVDSESIINPRKPQPWEIALEEEIEERFASGETIDSISEDIGISTDSLIAKLSGKFEHVLDLHGMGREKRSEVGQLYLDEGYEPDEIASLMGFEPSIVRQCIGDFYYRCSDSDRHYASSEKRWADPNAQKVPPRTKVLDPEEEKAKRRERSRQTAMRLGVDEEKASAFFVDRILPSRAEIHKSMDARIGVSRAMYAQGKTVSEISLAINVAEKTVERYLAKELAAAIEEQTSTREKVTREETVAAEYAALVPCGSMMPLPEEGGNVFVMPRTWPDFPQAWLGSWQSEARRLMAFHGYSLSEVAEVMHMSPSKIKKTLGDFGTTDTSATELQRCTVAAFLYDCLYLDYDGVAKVLGIEDDYDARIMLHDNHETPESRGWRRTWHANFIDAKTLSKLCGVNEELLKRAEKLGLMGGNEGYYGYSASTADILRLLGYLDPHPFPLIEETEATEDAE